MDAVRTRSGSSQRACGTTGVSCGSKSTHESRRPDCRESKERPGSGIGAEGGRPVRRSYRPLRRHAGQALGRVAAGASRRRHREMRLLPSSPTAGAISLDASQCGASDPTRLAATTRVVRGARAVLDVVGHVRASSSVSTRSSCVKGAASPQSQQAPPAEHRGLDSHAAEERRHGPTGYHTGQFGPEAPVRTPPGVETARYMLPLTAGRKTAA
jgi:hypothetical protein